LQDQGARPDACVLMVTAFASIELAVDAMRLGATDFLRKPIDAGDASRRGRRCHCRGARGPSAQEKRSVFHAGRARIETLTLNGFQILRSPELPPPSSLEHTFRVRHVADGVEFTVTVAIDTEAVERVARLTHRRLEPGGAFWRVQAERSCPAMCGVKKGASRRPARRARRVARDLDLAARWEDS